MRRGVTVTLFPFPFHPYIRPLQSEARQYHLANRVYSQLQPSMSTTNLNGVHPTQNGVGRKEKIAVIGSGNWRVQLHPPTVITTDFLDM